MLQDSTADLQEEISVIIDSIVVIDCFWLTIYQPPAGFSQLTDFSVQSFGLTHLYRFGQYVDLLLQAKQTLLVVPQRIRELITPRLLPFNGRRMFCERERERIDIDC